MAFYKMHFNKSHCRVSAVLCVIISQKIYNIQPQIQICTNLATNIGRDIDPDKNTERDIDIDRDREIENEIQIWIQ